jgi:hypothetical protein
VILLLASAQAAEWTVGVDAATITGTIALAASGDTIEVPAGTWHECVDTAGKSLALHGAGVLDGAGCDATVRIAGGETVVIEGLTLTNAEGRALHAEWSTVSLDGVTISDTGRADAAGGGIWAYGAALETTDCVFSGNEGSDGGAVYLYAYVTWADMGSRFTDNTAGSSGGAVFAYYDNQVSFEGSIFEGNRAGYYGGAFSSWDYSDLALHGAPFADNAAVTGGGAVMFYPVDSGAGVLDVAESRFVGNTSAEGGAFWIGWANQASLAGNQLEANTATGSGGAVLSYVTNTTTLADNLFCGNVAAAGGAVSVQWTAVDTWTNNRFVANSATSGGAAHRYASHAGSMVQNTFVGNAASGWGGAYHAAWAYTDFRNNVVADTPSGTGIYTAEAATEASTPVTFSGWSESAVADGSGYFWVGDGADGNVVADDPGFVAWDGTCGADLRLLGTSPFKDAGDPAVLDRDGTRSDMGAWGGPGGPVEDADGDSFDSTVDCDDTSAARGPEATETCNGLDDDCDGAVDEGAADATPWFTDADGDGFGDADAPTEACDAPTGAVPNNLDCDDADRWINPDASDLPGDGVDADCDGADNVQDIPAAEPAEPTGAGCACNGTSAGAGWGLVLLAAALARRAT